MNSQAFRQINSSYIEIYKCENIYSIVNQIFKHCACLRNAIEKNKIVYCTQYKAKIHVTICYLKLYIFKKYKIKKKSLVFIDECKFNTLNLKKNHKLKCIR